MATDMECQLFQVCETGDLDGFRRLYNADNSILNQKISGLQETPLHLATRFNHNNLVTEILNHGNHTAKAMNGEEDTPLHVACRLGELNIVNQLLDACSFVPYMLNKDKQSALFVACSCGHLGVALHLCDKMDLNVWDGIGALSLWIAASKGYQDVVLNILNKNPSLASRKGENGFSAMHLAAREGKIEVIKELLRKDINLSFLTENDGRTPLHLAAASRKVDAVKEFLPGSTLYNNLQVIIVDLINKADNDGNTILHHAANMNFSEIVKILMDMDGMNVNTVNKQGMAALDILEQQPASTQRDDIVQQLKAKKVANPTVELISLTALQQALMVVAALIVTITFQAGLNPPGGSWQDSNDHQAGKAIQSKTDPWLLMFFTIFDSIAFTVSLALLPVIMILRKEIVFYVNLLAAVALVFIELTFIMGLFMVSDGMPYVIVEIIFLLLPLAPFGWIQWKLSGH